MRRRFEHTTAAVAIAVLGQSAFTPTFPSNSADIPSTHNDIPYLNGEIQKLPNVNVLCHRVGCVIFEPFWVEIEWR